jgi:hypothetical protein
VRRQVNLSSVPRIICFHSPIFRVIRSKLLLGFRSKAAIIVHLLTGVRTGRRRHSEILFIPQEDSVPVSETHQYLEDAGQEKVTHTPV